MTFYQQQKVILFYRRLAILLGSFSTLAILFFAFLKTQPYNFWTVIINILTVGSFFLIFALTYISNFVKKNIDYIFYVLMLVLTIYVAYLTQKFDFELSYFAELIFSVIFVWLMPFRHKGKMLIFFDIVVLFSLTMFVINSSTREVEDITFLAILTMFMVLVYFISRQNEKLREEIDYLSKFPEWNPNLIIEVNAKGKVSYTNTKTRNMFPSIFKIPVNHPLISRAFVFEGNTFLLRHENMSDKIKIKGELYRRDIVFNDETGNSSVIYLTSLLEDEKNAHELTIAKAKLEEQQKALVNLLEDLSEEKEVKESQSQNMLENIGEGVVVTNDQGLVTFVNRAFQDITGIKYASINGQGFADVIKGFSLHGKQIEKAELGDAAMVTAREQETKIDILRPDGEKISVVINASPINVRGEFKGVIRIIHDISEEVKLQQQKDDFFSIASHELRTPLTVISGNLDIVLQGYGKSKLSKDDKDLLTDTIEASDRLIHMVNDFLNVSRIDQDRLNYEIKTIEANSIIASSLTQVQPLAQNKNIYLKFEPLAAPLIVNADENLLREIIINLVGNSIKFTKAGGITISEVVNNGILEVRVRDTGMGIGKEMQGLLFQRFQQAMGNTLAREVGGTGLGLYISREFARVMKGDLKLEESDLGKGSTFLLTLPLAEK